MADLNGLELSEAGTLLLGGSRALRAGPFVDLYRGGYKVTFTISIPQKRALPDAPICSVRVTDFNVETVYAEEDVAGSAFIGGQKAEVTLYFYTKASHYTRFQVLPADSQELEITGIRYQKISRTATEFKKVIQTQ